MRHGLLACCAGHMACGTRYSGCIANCSGAQRRACQEAGQRWCYSWWQWQQQQQGGSRASRGTCTSTCRGPHSGPCFQRRSRQGAQCSKDPSPRGSQGTSAEAAAITFLAAWCVAQAGPHIDMMTVQAGSSVPLKPAEGTHHAPETMQQRPGTSGSREDVHPGIQVTIQKLGGTQVCMLCLGLTLCMRRSMHALCQPRPLATAQICLAMY